MRNETTAIIGSTGSPATRDSKPGAGSFRPFAAPARSPTVITAAKPATSASNCSAERDFFIRAPPAAAECRTPIWPTGSLRRFSRRAFDWIGSGQNHALPSPAFNGPRACQFHCLNFGAFRAGADENLDQARVRGYPGALSNPQAIPDDASLRIDLMDRDGHRPARRRPCSMGGPSCSSSARACEERGTRKEPGAATGAAATPSPGLGRTSIRNTEAADSLSGPDDVLPLAHWCYAQWCYAPWCYWMLRRRKYCDLAFPRFFPPMLHMERPTCPGGDESAPGLPLTIRQSPKRRQRMNARS